jgi:CHAD domain-containing protein
MQTKWIDDVRAGERACRVAVRTLESRLAAVLELLPLAAHRADEDMEHVHALRVWTRRAAAAVTLYEEMMPRRRTAWIRKQLRRIRRAAGEARECDVLIVRLRRMPTLSGNRLWLQETCGRRVAAQKLITRVDRRLLRTPDKTCVSRDACGCVSGKERGRDGTPRR